jgi:hypothetical protein
MSMVRGAVAVAALVAAMSGQVSAGSNEVQYGPVPAWVVPLPSPTATEAPAGAPVRVAYLDSQMHAGPNGEEVFSAWRMRILKPEGLAVGSISLEWSPDAGEATVHRLQILRGATTIDVLASTKFEVLRREADLENAALNGRLTAILQVPGLQVGDEMELAATVRHKDRTLGEHAFGLGLLPPAGGAGVYRLRFVWPEARRMAWRATRDVPPLQETVRDGLKELVYELRDPAAVVVSPGAPMRMNLRRLVEYSDFQSWRDVSGRLSPLYETASVLAAASPVREEVSRIAASTPDPVRRTEAALQLVQERIRYVYVGLNGGNHRPAAIEDTWARRFGDCKAKTALLLAVLRELGVSAEPVLVNQAGGDGLDERLPSPALFDHVLVRARIGGAAHWLDGTRTGDKALSALPPPRYRWVLPVRAGGADLEAVPSSVPRSPQSITVLNIDVSGGFVERAPATGHFIVRGDEARKITSVIAAMTTADAERAIRTYVDRHQDGFESETASWRFDERAAVLRLSVTGTIKVEWEGDDEEGRRLDILGAGFRPPAEYRRLKEEDQTAPWMTEYPAYRCWATVIRLPESAPKWKWHYRARPVNRTMGGVTYWRVADLRDGAMRTVMSRRVDVTEISAEEAQEVNRLRPTFDNKVSYVYQIAADTTAAAQAPMPVPPFGELTDWMAAATPCDAAPRP